METLIRVCTKLEKLMAIKGKNDKQAFVAENKDDKEFLTMLDARLNPYKQYKIKSDLPRLVYSFHTTTFDDFTKLLDTLSTSNINSKLKQYAETLVLKAPNAHIPTLWGIVTKSLNLGIDTGVNKALGYELIPSFDCMLAAPLKDSMEIKFPVIAELKYDGVRCLAFVKDGKVSLLTRQGRQLSFPRIEAELVKLATGADVVFDMELETESRTGISGICNSNLKTGYKDGSDGLIKAYVFDMIPLDTFISKGKTDAQHVRTLKLQQLFMSSTGLKHIYPTVSMTINSYDKLMEVSRAFMADGYEGLIVKDRDAPYHYKRNKAWLKIKAINSATLKVIGTTMGKGKRTGKVGALICESEDSKLSVMVGSGLSDELIDELSQNDPTGLCVEVLFNVVIQGEGSDTFSLFLPRYKEFRIDKDRGDTLQDILDGHIGKPEIQ